jgi:hypothetical protein
MRRAGPKASSIEEDRSGEAIAERISKKITAPQYNKTGAATRRRKRAAITNRFDAFLNGSSKRKGIGKRKRKRSRSRKYLWVTSSLASLANKEILAYS